EDVFGESMTEVNGDLLCESCERSARRSCKACHDDHYRDGHDLCEDCEDTHHWCDDCDDWIADVDRHEHCADCDETVPAGQVCTCGETEAADTPPDPFPRDPHYRCPLTASLPFPEDTHAAR